jgi:hypothetical protein
MPRDSLLIFQRQFLDSSSFLPQTHHLDQISLSLMLSILRKARLKDKEMRILMLCVGSDWHGCKWLTTT